MRILGARVLLEKGVTKMERGKIKMHPVVLGWKGKYQYELVVFYI